MTQEHSLIATIATGLAAAFFGGFLATRLRLPAIVGYLLAGVAIGPFTPGLIADRAIASQLAEIGVILLMFGVGLHFSLRDLFAVRMIALPGAIAQIAVATALGTGMAVLWWGWSIGAGLVLGLAISIASTIVLLRELAERDALGSVQGHVAVGWLIVQDLFAVLVLVLLPALAPSLGAIPGAGEPAENVFLSVGVALGKLAALAALMLFVGARAIPWLLDQVAHTGSRELFTLAVLALAVGVAFGSAIAFGASLALGAFLAGAVLSESDLSHQAAADALPLRDAFAVLFFVSVGMLFDPNFLLAAPGMLVAVLAVIVVGNGLTALFIVVVLGYPLRIGLTVAAGLMQIGEFSFILAELGRRVGLLPGEGQSLILGAAIISITLNPLAFRAIDPIEAWVRRRPRLPSLLQRNSGSLAWASEEGGDGAPRGHAVLCGHGRVGSLIAEVLARRGLRYIVIEQNRRLVAEVRRGGVVALYGDAANPVLLQHAHVESARVLILAISDPLAIRHVVDRARRMNPQLSIVARTHSEAEWAYLREHGVDEVVLGERELAVEMSRYTLHRFGISGAELQAIVQGLRQRNVAP
jgi:monovalent cation:H+ antiporter-2, CPA2 family